MGMLPRCLVASFASPVWERHPSPASLITLLAVPQVVYTEPNDEIVDLVERVRTVPDRDVALVLNPGTTGFQTPLNVRLLHQLGTRAGKTVSVISGDAHIQELSRFGGLPTYASVPAYERGIQTVRPHADGAAGITAVGAAAGAGLPAYPPAPPPPPGPPSPAATGATTMARTRPVGRRRPLYLVAIAAAVLGVLLLLLVLPSARVGITLVGSPVAVSPTIQGSTDPASAAQPDHIVTTALTSNPSSQFTATPTGSQQVPAKAATGTITFSTVIPTGAQFTVPKGTEFDTQDNPPIRFMAKQTTGICIGPSGSTPGNCPPGNPPNDAVPVIDATPEAKGNVGANAITRWPGNPCPAPPDPATNFPGCAASDLTVTNPQPTAGGVDAKTTVVASPADVGSWNSQVAQSERALTAQAMQDLQSKAAGKTLARDPGGNGTNVSCALTPPLPAANAPFTTTQVTVACAGKATAYSPGDIPAVVRADLQAELAQGDALAVNAISCTNPAVTQATPDGTVVLSIQCTSYSMPGVDLEALRGQLTGRSPGEAKNIVEHRLAHVQNVTVSQSPIPFFWLPLFASRIQVGETFVTQPPR